MGHLKTHALRRESGFSLLEVILIMGLMSLAALIAASLVVQPMKAQATIDSRTSFEAYLFQIEALSKTVNCNYFFSPTRSLAGNNSSQDPSKDVFNNPPILQIPEVSAGLIRSSSPSPYLAVGHRYPGFTLTQIQLAGITASGGPQAYTANLVLTAQIITPSSLSNVTPLGALGGNLLTNLTQQSLSPATAAPSTVPGYIQIPLNIYASASGNFAGCGLGPGGLGMTGPSGSVGPEVSTWIPLANPDLKQDTVASSSVAPPCPTSTMAVAVPGTNCLTPSPIFPGRYLVNTFVPISSTQDGSTHGAVSSNGPGVGTGDGTGDGTGTGTGGDGTGGDGGGGAGGE